jgi:hypothetical protein
LTLHQNTKEPLRIKFDPTINLGHVLTFVGFVVAGFIAYQALEKRVLILETNQQRQELRDAQQDRDTSRISEDTKAALEEIKRLMERVDNKVDRLAR